MTDRAGLLGVRPVVTQAQRLVSCPAVTVLKFFRSFDKGVSHFHFALGPAKSVAGCGDRAGFQTGPCVSPGWVFSIRHRASGRSRMDSMGTALLAEKTPWGKVVAGAGVELGGRPQWMELAGAGTDPLWAQSRGRRSLSQHRQQTSHPHPAGCSVQWPPCRTETTGDSARVPCHQSPTS